MRIYIDSEYWGLDVLSCLIGANTMSRQSLQSIGEASFARSEKVSAELFALTYGSFVRQLLLDYERAEDVNKQLDEIGYKMGIRLIDDFLAKSKLTTCTSFTETADVIAKVAFKMFLGVSGSVINWSSDKKTFSLAFDDNPLAEFAELPEDHPSLWYSNVLCGVIRGALEMVNMKVSCSFVKCKLRGDDHNEMRISLHEILIEQVRRPILDAGAADVVHFKIRNGEEKLCHLQPFLKKDTNYICACVHVCVC